MCPQRWNVRRHPDFMSHSDMYWISPADVHVHVGLLSVLGLGEFYEVLREMASMVPCYVKHLTVCQLTFVIVSHCHHHSFHVDFGLSLSGQAWSVMIPVILVNDSPLELLVKIMWQLCRSGSTS